MKHLLTLILAAALASCAPSRPAPPVERTVAPVYVPVAPAAPDVAEVEKSVRDLSEEVGDARAEVRRASDKVAEGVKESVMLRELIEREYNAAEITAQAALENIRHAAGRTEAKLNDTVGLLDAAAAKLTAANNRSAELSAQVSSLKSVIAVQTSQVEEALAAARSANFQTDLANSQKDEFRNALNASEGEMIALTKERDAARAHRRNLIIATVILALAVIGLLFRR